MKNLKNIIICVIVFTIVTLLGMFIIGNTNVFEWDEEHRFMVVISSITISFAILLIDKINDITNR